MIMKNIKEEQNIKSTLNKPISVQSKGFEKNFKKTMTQVTPNIKLNEIDDILSEAEFSLKKKIFSLPKMEALVFSDPKLSAVYDEMSENGEQRFGYHYNETIMNMLFNDYVLNSPKYLQKYKQAIPKEKKRRDKSGINQLKKNGEEIMTQTNPNEKIKTNLKQDSLKENNIDSIDQPQEDDCFVQSNGFKLSVSCGGKFIGEFVEDNDAYNAIKQWKTKNNWYPNTWFISDHGNVSLIDDDGNILKETTTAGSAGGAAGYVGYAGPAAWSKNGKPTMNKPIWKGGSIIAESDYLIESTGFEKYYNELNEQSNVDFITKHSEAYGDLNNMNNNNLNIIKKDIQDRKLDNSNINNSVTTNDNLSEDGFELYEINNTMISNSNRQQKINFLKNYFESDNQSGYPPTPTDWLVHLDDSAINVLYKNALKNQEKNLDEKSVSKKQQRFMGMVHAVQKGELSPEKVGDDVEKAAETMTKNDVEDFASTKHKGLPEKVDENSNINIDNVLQKVITNIKSSQTIDHFKSAVNYANIFLKRLKIEIGDINRVRMYRYDLQKVVDETAKNLNINTIQLTIENNIKEDTQTMIQSNNTSMSNKATPTGDQSSNMENGISLNESDVNFLKELDEELNAYSVYNDKLKKISEDRKPSALVLRDRVGSENEKNFKKDLQHSGTKEIINVEKELQYKDQQTDVGKNPQKLGQDIEKKELKITDGEALKNVGDSTNNEGDEIPKRNLTKEEQDEVNKYRLGLGDLVYDNEPGKHFEDRMKADMGDKFYKERQEKLKFRGKAPMYNKDTQPVKDGVEKVQFDKEKSGWAEREGIKESVITGKYFDVLGKKRILDFNLNEVAEIKTLTDKSELFELNFDGLGNTYTNKADINESFVKIGGKYKFYTNGKNVFVLKNLIQKLNENEQKENKKTINEQYDKMKHLLDYKPKNFVNTNNVKKNRGF